MVSKPTELTTWQPCRGPRSFSPSGCDPDGRTPKGSEKLNQTVAVRYGLMSYVGEFKYAAGVISECGTKVVIQTIRGIEIGQRVSLTCTGCEKSINRQQMSNYVKNSGADVYQPKAGRILRAATAQDLQEEARINEDAKRKFTRAGQLARAGNLPMKFVACEHLFGGERIVFHFMAESRVDFRELVRELAHEYHTRIEMRQVGARDEARLVADYEICGRECCCKNFLKKLRPINMRMAKLQKATLDPSKVSGRCGRLRCCLRYEHEGYEELNKKLPRVGVRIRTQRGIGTIAERQVLTQLLFIAYDKGEQVEFIGLEEILETGLPKIDPAMPPASRTQNPADKHRREPGGPEPKADDTASVREETRTGGPPPAGERGGRRRRAARRRSRAKSTAAPAVHAPDAPAKPSRDGTAGGPPGVADTPPDADGVVPDATAPPPGSSKHGPVPGTERESAGHNRRSRRRGRQGRRRRRGGKTEQAPGGSLPGTPAEPGTTRGDASPKTENRPSMDPDDKTD